MFLNAFVACLGKSCLKLHCPIRDKNFEFKYLISIPSKILNFDLLKDLYCILFWQNAQLCIAVKTTKTVEGNKLIVMCKFFAYVVANRVEMKFLHYTCGCLEFQKIEAKYVFMGPSCHIWDISEIVIVCCSLQLKSKPRFNREKARFKRDFILARFDHNQLTKSQSNLVNTCQA